MSNTAASDYIEALLATLDCLDRQLAEQRATIETMRNKAILCHKRDHVRALIREVLWR